MLLLILKLKRGSKSVHRYFNLWPAIPPAYHRYIPSPVAPQIMASNTTSIPQVHSITCSSTDDEITKLFLMLTVNQSLLIHWSFGIRIRTCGLNLQLWPKMYWQYQQGFIQDFQFGDVVCGLTGIGEYTFLQVTPRNGANSIVVSFLF